MRAVDDEGLLFSIESSGYYLHRIERCYKQIMNEKSYKCRIRVLNRDRVRIELTTPGGQLIGEPSGQFGYSSKKRDTIQQLYARASDNLLNDEDAQNLGESLFTMLFDQALQSEFLRIFAEARQEGASLHIELDIDEVEVPDIASLPWEFLRVPTQAGYGSIWLATSPDIVFSRYRAKSILPQPVQLGVGERLRIALVISSPKGLGVVRYEEVIQILTEVCTDNPTSIELLTPITEASIKNIDAVLESRPHIFHFIGHADFLSEGDGDSGKIALIDEMGNPLWIDAVRFSELFNRHQPSIVLLQACEGAKLSSSKAFVGVASQVIEHNIPIVIAMQFEISNFMARIFSLEFYKRLVAGSQITQATQEGRRQMALRNRGYSDRAFATPVLFSRVPNSRLLRQHLYHSTEIDGLIEKHKETLIDDLKGDWFDQFINLYMIETKLTHQWRHAARNDKQFTIFEIAEQFQERPIAILGEPGAGKTTLVKMLAIEYARKQLRIPIFLNIGLVYTGQDELIELFDTPIPKQVLTELLTNGHFLVIFDGLNEVSRRLSDGDLPERAARAIVRFARKYPSNQFIVTCRTAEFPSILRTEMLNFGVVRLGDEMVQSFLESTLGKQSARNLYRKLPSQIRDLCRNPLLLNMLSYSYREHKILDHIPETRSEMYSLFLNNLYEREETLRTMVNSQSTREDVIRYIARRMNNETVSVRRGVLESWIVELFREKYRGTGMNILTLFHETLDLPPLQPSEPGHRSDIPVSFMHQSFQEYYTAGDLHFRYLQGELSLNRLMDYATVANEHWWETLILFVGLLKDATEVINAIKQTAEATEEQRVFTLAARCIRECKYINPVEVDDIIIRTLLAFKFGRVAFDYDLIYGLRLIREEQRSNTFPTRLVEDLSWWLEKWARSSPTHLSDSLSIQDLVNLLDSEDESLAIDAAFTIRGRIDRALIIGDLIHKLETSSGEFREQLIATMGYLGNAATDATDYLVKIIQNPNETKWARGYALGALGKIGDIDAVQPIVEYMLNHNNPFRDGASWALQGIAKQHRENSNLISQLKAAYMEALLHETDDLEGRYAKGNIIYSLGELDATEYIDRILGWLENETDPYVIEDAVQALGRLGNPKALDQIIANLSHKDPVIRMTATNALVSVAQNSVEEVAVIAHLTPLLRDESALVRDSTGLALKSWGDQR